MRDEPKEFELKFEVAEDALPDVAAASERLAADGPVRQRILSTYFDTGKHALRHAGISLRVRRIGGGWRQTVKLDTDVHGGVSNPTEIETPVPGKKPQLDLIADRKVRKKLRKLVGKKKLKPLFRTDVLRTTHLIKSSDSEVELALDGGSIEAKNGMAAICEAELELKRGDAVDLLEVAQHLFSDVPFGFGSQSKASRGYQLIASGEPEPLAPVKASKPSVHPRENVSQAFARISQSSADQVLNNWKGLQTGDDPEFAHQMRVGLRRLRTAVRVFRGAIDTPELRTLVRDLGLLGRRVGKLRDADVLLADIARPVLNSPESPGGARELERFLGKHGDAVRKSLRREFQETGWNALLLRVSLLPHGAGWAGNVDADGEIADYAPLALEKCWKPVIKRASRLDDLDTEERHSLRKNLKTLRYTLEFFAPALPAGKAEKFVEHLKELQDSFGYLNDVALAQTLPEITKGATQKSRRLSRTVSDVLDWHSQQAEDAWRNTQQQWRQLEEQPKPWIG